MGEREYADRQQNWGISNHAANALVAPGVDVVTWPRELVRTGR
jgi:hypothetical protein